MNESGKLLSRLFQTSISALFLLGCGEQPEAQVQTPPPQRRGGFQFHQEVASPADNLAAFAVSTNVQSKLPTYEIRMKVEDLATLEESPFSQDLIPASLVFEGELFPNLKIRHRGAWGRTWPKKPLKIFFNEDKPFKDQYRLNLNSSFRDPSFIREPLAYHIYQACGAPASRSEVVRVHLNDHFRGLYIQVEQPDKAMMKRLGLKGAIVMKASSRMKQGDERPLGDVDMYRMHYEQETQKKEQDGFTALQKFCDQLAAAADPLEFFEKNVDLEKYINYLAATALVQNWDGFSKNHFLVFDSRDSKKWFILPWDLDRTLGDHWDWSFGRADLPVNLGTRTRPGVTGWNRLMERFFSHPELRRRFANRLQHLLEHEFTMEKLGPVIDEMQASIGAEAASDYRRWPNTHRTPWYRDDQTSIEEHIKTVKRYIEKRRAFLQRELSSLRSAG